MSYPIFGVSGGQTQHAINQGVFGVDLFRHTNNIVVLLMGLKVYLIYRFSYLTALYASCLPFTFISILNFHTITHEHTYLTSYFPAGSHYFDFQEKYGPKGQGKALNAATAKPNKDIKQKPEVDINVGLSERPPWFCRYILRGIRFLVPW